MNAKYFMRYRKSDNGIQHFVEEFYALEWKISKVFYEASHAKAYITVNGAKANV